MKVDYHDPQSIKEYLVRHLNVVPNELDLLSLCSIVNEAFHDGRDEAMDKVTKIISGSPLNAPLKDDRYAAAAPDLLGALHAMLLCCYDEEIDDQTIRAVRDARQAIAKATGKAQ